jgi:hypothetical protein
MLLFGCCDGTRSDTDEPDAGNFTADFGPDRQQHGDIQAAEETHSLEDEIHKIPPNELTQEPEPAAPEPEPEPEPAQEKSGSNWLVDVSLDISSGQSMGFKIGDDETSGTGVCIFKLVAGGLAEADDVIKAGDKLMSLNGVDISNMRERKKIREIMMASPNGIVALTLSRAVPTEGDPDVAGVVFDVNGLKVNAGYEFGEGDVQLSKSVSRRTPALNTPHHTLLHSGLPSMWRSLHCLGSFSAAGGEHTPLFIFLQVPFLTIPCARLQLALTNNLHLMGVSRYLWVLLHSGQSCSIFLKTISS